jgi:hypothetical protein
VFVWHSAVCDGKAASAASRKLAGVKLGGGAAKKPVTTTVSYTIRVYADPAECEYSDDDESGGGGGSSSSGSGGGGGGGGSEEEDNEAAEGARAAGDGVAQADLISFDDVATRDIF